MKTNCKLLLKLILFFFFLGFSDHVISVAAVPSTRTLNLDAKSSIPQEYLPLHQEIKNNNKNNMEVVITERYDESRRMDIETNDYPDPGANRDHDPPVSGGGGTP